jgi:hypothetical protein
MTITSYTRIPNKSPSGLKAATDVQWQGAINQAGLERLGKGISEESVQLLRGS